MQGFRISGENQWCDLKVEKASKTGPKTRKNGKKTRFGEHVLVLRVNWVVLRCSSPGDRLRR
jgi:hypothetical protein